MLDDSQTLSDRIAKLRAHIPPTVRLIAVSKTVSVEQMRLAYAAGIRDFGENRVQDALAKQAALADLADITWHFIGHLQTNKAAKAVQHFDWIHSVDSLKLAQRLSQVIPPHTPSPKLCLQVKLRPDPSKTGWNKADLEAVLPQLNALDNLNLCGLMTIPPLHSNPEEILKIFQEARILADSFYQNSLIRLNELSMGMSEDYGLAIQAGSTMVRLGRVLFGDRNE